MTFLRHIYLSSKSCVNYACIYFFLFYILIDRLDGVLCLKLSSALFCYIMAVSFCWLRSRSAQREPSNFDKKTNNLCKLKIGVLCTCRV